jgi:hypothetical protein
LHGKVNPRTYNQCRTYSCTVKTMLSKRLGMGWESHLSLLPFACQRALSYRTLYVLQEYMHMGGTPQFPQPLVSMMVCKRHLDSSTLRGEYQRFNLLVQNWVGMRCAEKDGKWLGSSSGPHTKEVWTGKIARLCSKALISLGCTHLCRM